MATKKRLIDTNALIEAGNEATMIDVFPDWNEMSASAQEAVCKHGQYLKKLINELPAVDAVEVTADELKHLINDTIAYIWRLEERGCNKPEFGYDSRKTLLEKLKRFEKEHFPQHECCMEE